MWANNKDVCGPYQWNSCVLTLNQTVNATQNKCSASTDPTTWSIVKKEKKKNSEGFIDCMAPWPGRHLEAVQAETKRLWTTLLNSRQALTRWKERLTAKRKKDKKITWREKERQAQRDTGNKAIKKTTLKRNVEGVGQTKTEETHGDGDINREEDRDKDRNESVFPAPLHLPALLSAGLHSCPVLLFLILTSQPLCVVAAVSTITVTKLQLF